MDNAATSRSGGASNAEATAAVVTLVCAVGGAGIALLATLVAGIALRHARRARTATSVAVEGDGALIGLGPEFTVALLVAVPCGFLAVLLGRLHAAAPLWQLLAAVAAAAATLGAGTAALDPPTPSRDAAPWDRHTKKE